MKKPLLLLCFSLFSNLLLSNENAIVKFGNAVYVNLSVGEKFKYEGHDIEVLKIANHKSLVSVNGEEAWLEVAKRSLPKTIGGLSVFVSDQINVKRITTDSLVRNLLQKDVLLCLSAPGQRLLDPSEFDFPISNRDGYVWEIGEDSHMFAYLGSNAWMGRPNSFRSHEGIDFNLHEARGLEMHPIVAIEAATVILVADSTVTKSVDGCIILKSNSQDNIYYVYKHTNPKTHKVKEGQLVKKGDILSYIWGDDVWGHLHFSVVYRSDPPAYQGRYKNVLNFFPHLYELRYGSEPVPNIRTSGNFTFGYSKQYCNNIQRLDEFNELTGYGWVLGDWCIAQKVERTSRDSTGNVRLKKVLHAGTQAESTNPNSHYDFDVLVENGSYTVSVTIGDAYGPSLQRVFFENQDIGVFNLEGSGQLVETKEYTVDVQDGRLTIRMELLDPEKFASIRALRFRKLD